MLIEHQSDPEKPVTLSSSLSVERGSLVSFVSLGLINF